MLKTVKEKIAYLRGLLDGDSSLQEGRNGFMFGKILQVLEELAQDVDTLAQGQEELDEYLEEVDFDLAYLEDEFFSEDADDRIRLFDEDDEWDDYSDDSLVEIQCPDCADIVTFDEEFLFDEGVQVRCPRCDAVVFESDDFADLEDLYHEDYSGLENMDDQDDED